MKESNDSTAESMQDHQTKLLSVAIGSCSRAGKKPSNEDCVAYQIPNNNYELEHKGIAVALADGVSSAEAGKEASETAVNNFINDYYQTPDTWSVAHAGQKILTSINLKLFRRSHEFTNEEKGYLCTFSGLIIKSRIVHCFHAGDSRIFRYSGGSYSQLTRDHIANIGSGRSILARAVGMDNSLQIDYLKQPLQQGDLFLITSDGVHDFVTEEQIVKVLTSQTTAQQKAESLVSQALQQGSDDNVSCAVIEVLQLPEESLDDYNTKLTRLPFPPSLEPGMKIDGFIIKHEIFASSRSQLYLVEEEAPHRLMVMKTPSVNYEDDTSYIDRFIQEEWIGKRIDSPYVVKILAQKSKRNFLYYLMEYIEGETLEKWMAKHRFPRPKIAIQIVDQIAKGLAAFHDQETIHQDMKPGNVMIDKHGEVKIIDFGSVYVAGIAEVFRPIVHEHALGTASYSDPQYLLGINSGIQGDLYALATITYELFTGELPFGDKIEECRSAMDYDRLRYRNANQFNPVIPAWFDRALQRGLKFDLEQRYRTLDAFLQDLHEPNPEYLLDDPNYTKDKSKALFWQIISGFWLLTLILLYLLFSS
ncbi:bifunctional protein-serine/threonine kinase/phosphatase [Pleionea sediminis]|uniref:bifunctional protein-serine/threonine kinase/phosphatase n=1 Tax=Pleionea sediminis TaxID=2569479 RepID=UPI001FE4FF32|nr:bifunctional protein-serine/threonine kinase/phosphatase [Pleionea sediminis]